MPIYIMLCLMGAYEDHDEILACITILFLINLGLNRNTILYYAFRVRGIRYSGESG